MGDVKKSRRGVYYDLSKSPYEYKSPYGDLLKFSSQKRLDIYERDITKELKRADALINRNELRTYIPDEIIRLVYRSIYLAFYNRVEGTRKQ